MANMLDLITKLRGTDAHATQLFNLFADHMRESFGACAMALICTEGLAYNQFRILWFSDEQGRQIIDELNFSAMPQAAILRRGEDLSTLLDPSQPVIRQCTEHGIDPMFGDLFKKYIDVISLPLLQHDGVHRWLLMLYAESGRVDQIDLERGLEIATLAINYVYSVEAAQRLAEANAWIKSELEAIGRIQQLLLPQDLSDTPGIEVARLFQPHAYVGGDYYEIVPLSTARGPDHQDADPGVWGFMIADASGHGAAAAVEIAMFDAVLRTYKPAGVAEPGDVLNYANRYFFTRMLRGSFITAFVSKYDPPTGILTYANAGHPRPFVKRAGSTELATLERCVGMPLGVDRRAHWDSVRVSMAIGDLLIMYTDGITEARSSGGQAFGLERLRAVIADAPQEPQACMASIQRAVTDHLAGMPANDDQTLLVVQITD